MAYAAEQGSEPALTDLTARIERDWLLERPRELELASVTACVRALRCGSAAGAPVDFEGSARSPDCAAESDSYPSRSSTPTRKRRAGLAAHLPEPGRHKSTL